MQIRLILTSIDNIYILVCYQISNISHRSSKNRIFQKCLDVIKSTLSPLLSNCKSSFVFIIPTFSNICCTVIKYVLPDPCLSFPNCFSRGSVVNVPSKTYL